jgi:bifunctional non-homologous end joining protein LigD
VIVGDPLEALPEEARRLARRTPQPDWVQPMLATLTEHRFSDPGWIFERKLDGVRVLAFRRRGEVRLLSRNQLDVGGAYPEVVEALQAGDGPNFIVDGEVVAFDHGQTSFAKLQQRMQLRDPVRARQTGVPIFYYVFDVIHAGGFDLAPLELRHRKAVLRSLLRFERPIRLTTHRNTEGEAFYAEACRKGWEGLIAKRAGSKYVSGRSPDWLKFKCVNEQEFVIVGFTDPKGSRLGLGALLIGYHEDGRLRYGGKVGTGFNEQLLRELRARLDQLERDIPTIDGKGLPRKGVHWVEPQLVAQVGFTEWTRDGQLRHPRFLGLREDKPPSDVVRERPAR